MKAPKARTRLLIVALLVVGSGAAGYCILLNPGSIWVRWARAEFPSRITMITFGPYPSAKELKSFSEKGGKYDVSLLDPRLPYEKELIEHEKAEAVRDGLIVKDFPMASVFDHQIFSDYKGEEQKAVDFLKHLDGPAYVHCYLGKHRVLHVRNALLKAGVPASYWTPSGTRKEYWDLVNRLADARKEFQQGKYAQVITTLEPIKTPDADVAGLRGWSKYRMGLFKEAAAEFQSGLDVEPHNPHDLEGLGYCYLREGNPVMAQRAFSLVLNREPQNEGALEGQGLAFLALQNKPAAAEMFRQALAKDPGNDEVRNDLKRAESD
jgi:tetratricopeptide (TPR) repeat protein